MTRQTGHDVAPSPPRRSLGMGVLRYRILAFLAILGPGFVTANVDNDPGGILTYSQAGAKFGYALLWTLIPITVALIVVQEMAARMGVVTGKGLSDLIREEFGLRMTFLAMFLLSLADLGNIMAEFAGIASGMAIFGVSKYISVPIGAFLVWIVIVKGTYRPVERLLILFSLIYFAYPISAILAKPDWSEALYNTVVPQFRADHAYTTMVIGLIGTTITPWMQFYLQAAIVEKGLTKKDYRVAKWDVIVGCIITDVVAFFIMVACAATIHKAGLGALEDPAEAAVALRPFAGEFASFLFGLGLVNASVLSAAVLPLATAYNICEGLGFESGVDKSFREAKVFYTLYTGLIVLGAGAVLIPGIPLLKVILLSQVANGILLPFVLVFMLILVNRHDLMGSMRNRRAGNVIAGSLTVALIILTLLLLWQTIVG